MRITCPNCGTAYHLKKELITPKGLKLVCKRCGHVFVVRLKDEKSQAEGARPSRVEKETTGREPEQKAAEHEAARADRPVEESIREATVKEEEPLPLLTPHSPPPESRRRWPAFLTYLICIAIIGSCLLWIRWRSYRNWRNSAVELAQLYRSHGYLHEALLSLRNSLEAHPDSPEVNYQMGELLYMLSRRDEAAPYFQKVLKKSGFPAKIEGSLMILAGRPKEGIAWLAERMAAADNETRGMLLNDRAIGEIFSHKRSKGWGDLKKAAKLWNSPVPTFNLGTLALEEADGPTCVKQLELLREAFPGNPIVLNNLALCYALLGEKAKAIFLLNSAVDHSIYSPYIWKNLAILTGNQLIPLYQAEADEIKGDDLAPIPYLFAFSWQLNPQ